MSTKEFFYGIIIPQINTFAIAKYVIYCLYFIKGHVFNEI